LLTGSTAAGELIEISSYLTVDVPLIEVLGIEMRPADHRIVVNIDVHSDAARNASALVLTRINVGHRERLGLLGSESIGVAALFPLMLARYNAAMQQL